MPTLCRISFRLCFLHLPNVEGERIFRDELSFEQPEDRCYDDLCAMIDRKLAFLDFRGSSGHGAKPYSIFYTEAATGDRCVVDDRYFDALLRQWERRVRQLRLNRGKRRRSEEGDGGEAVGGRGPVLVIGAAEDSVASSDDSTADDLRPPDLTETFEVEVSAVPAPPLPAHADPPCAPLTGENLAKLRRSAALDMGSTLFHPAMPKIQSSTAPAPPPEPVVRIGQLQCPPVPSEFSLRCVILSIRFKTPKPDLTVAELDLCDAANPAEKITAVTFDAVVQQAYRQHLHGDGRQVVQLRHVYVRRKNETDLRFQTNVHPLLLRLDRSSKVEVVQMLAAPITSFSAADTAGVVTIAYDRQQPQPKLFNVHQLLEPPGGLPPRSTAVAAAPSLSSSTTSSSVGGPRRTTFTFSSSSDGQASSTALVSGVVPSTFGRQLRTVQEGLLADGAARGEKGAGPHEPGVIPIGTSDVRQRERLVEQHANKEEERKERIRRKKEVSQTCLLCGLDCDKEEMCMQLLRGQLTRSTRNRGQQIPTLAQLRQDLGDGRRVARGATRTRLVCQRTFVDTNTRTVHVVHPRCVHLCSAYQAGNELEDLVVCDLAMNRCSLCGMAGASVACYHPACTEMYHVVCALYSNGYVNFGQRDPYLPCPACPRHTQVIVSKGHSSRKAGEEPVRHVDTSCWEDGIAFDSRVVESTDLRDPDENDGM